jgi:hypothetical protein
VRETNPVDGNTVCSGFRVGTRENTYIAQSTISDDGKDLLLMTLTDNKWEWLKIDISTGAVLQVADNRVNVNLRNEAYWRHDMNLTNDSEYFMMVHYSGSDANVSLVYYDYKTGCIEKAFNYNKHDEHLYVINNRTNIAKEDTIVCDSISNFIYSITVFFTIGYHETAIEDFLLIPSHLKRPTFVFERL